MRESVNHLGRQKKSHRGVNSNLLATVDGNLHVSLESIHPASHPFQHRMGSDHSRSTGGQSVEVGPPDYYHSLQVNEDATDDELKVRQLGTS